MKRLVVLLVVASCRIAAAQAPHARDSAGVRIIENGPRLTAPVVFQLGDKPSFDVGGLQQDPADELSSRNGYWKAIRIPNGNVAILDKTRVLFFDASGKRIKSFGRQGRGPGEFEQATNICATRGDTVLVGENRRPLTKLTKDGNLAATVPLPEASLTEGDICFDDGSFVVVSRVASGRDIPPIYRFTRVAPDGATNVIIDHQYPPFDPLVRMENPIVARGSRMYFANGNTFDIKAYDRAGKLAEIIRTSDAMVPLTDDEKAKMSPGAFRAGSTPAEREDARRRAIAGSKTKYWPTVNKMFVDQAGRIWVEDWQGHYWQSMEALTKPQGWAAFDSTGRLLGRLIIPAGKSKEERRFVVHFGKDEVFFNRLDDDGAVHYTAYPILPVKK